MSTYDAVNCRQFMEDLYIYEPVQKRDAKEASRVIHVKSNKKVLDACVNHSKVVVASKAKISKIIS